MLLNLYLCFKYEMLKLLNGIKDFDVVVKVICGWNVEELEKVVVEWGVIMFVVWIIEEFMNEFVYEEVV